MLRLVTGFFVLGGLSAMSTAETIINVPGPNKITIQDGIDQAQPGDIVQIAAGTYLQSMDFNGKAITVQGVINSDHTHATWIQGFSTDINTPLEDTNPLVTCNTSETSATVIKDLGFQKSMSVSGYGAIQIENASPTIENCYFRDLGFFIEDDGSEYFTANGSAIAIQGGSPTVMKSVFSNCMAFYGGAIYGDACTLTVKDSIFTNCTTQAGFTVDESDQPVWIDYSSKGGAINVNNSALIVESSSFNRCITGVTEGVLNNPEHCGGGGAIYTTLPQEVVIRGCYFLGNSTQGTDSCGGAINIATGYENDGGGSSPTVPSCGDPNSLLCCFCDSCDIPDRCFLLFNGGGGNTLSTALIDDCYFLENYVPNKGGAIFNNEIPMVVSNCQFVENGAGNADDENSAGGAIIAFVTDIIGSTFTNNSTIGTGGAVYLTGYTGEGEPVPATFEDVTFNGNSCTGGHSYSTGGALSLGSHVNLVVKGDSSFTSNTAYDLGGAIQVGSDCSLTMTEVAVTGNSITDSGYGGGISLKGGANQTCTANLTGCTVSNNSSPGYGGGLSLEMNSEVTMTDCFIDSNTSGSDDGGGVYMDQSGNSSVFTNCLIRNNTSGGDGGGFHLRYSSPTLVDCRVSYNYSGNHGGGIWVSDLAKVTLDGTSVCENTADHSSTDQVDGDHNLEGDYYIGTDCPSTGCEGLLTGDVNGDCVVNGVDLGMVLSTWGSCAGCATDLTGDDVVSGADVGVVLGSWGDSI